MSYAKNTKVPIERSQGEIRKILTKHGATGFAFAENDSLAQVIFELKGYRIKFNLPMPCPPNKNSTEASKKFYFQLCKSKWRSLVLAIKAKMECVQSGITTIEQEFLAHIVLPNGITVGHHTIPQLKESYESNKMPTLLEFSK